MPGPGPHFMPPEEIEARDARTEAENEQRDALRRELLDLQEQVNAARVHYGEALRAAGYDRDIPAEVERAFEQPSSNAPATGTDKPTGE